MSSAQVCGLPLCMFSLTVNSHHLRASGLTFSMHLKEPNAQLGNYILESD